MKKKKELKEGNINLAHLISRFLAKPEFQNADETYVRATLFKHFPQLAKKDKCFNCNASMEQNVFFFDILDAVLLKAMADEVRKRMKEGIDFTVANQIRVQDLPTSLSVHCRTTSNRYLGLVAKVKNENNRHAKGIWLVTKRGWEAMRGEAVPAKVCVFRGEIQERFEEKITLAEAFNVHRDKVEEAIARHKEPKKDYRKEVEDYNASDWVGFGGYYQGNLKI